MFDERKDNNGNIYLIYVLNNISFQDIIHFIQLKNLEFNYEGKYIFLSYIENKNQDDQDNNKINYRLFENRLEIDKKINYDKINENTKYFYPIIIFSRNIDNIVKNNNELIPEKETYGVIGE